MRRKREVKRDEPAMMGAARPDIAFLLPLGLVAVVVLVVVVVVVARLLVAPPPPPREADSNCTQQ